MRAPGWMSSAWREWRADDLGTELLRRTFHPRDVDGTGGWQLQPFRRLPALDEERLAPHRA